MRNLFENSRKNYNKEKSLTLERDNFFSKINRNILYNDLCSFLNSAITLSQPNSITTDSITPDTNAFQRLSQFFVCLYCGLISCCIDSEVRFVNTQTIALSNFNFLVIIGFQINTEIGTEGHK